MRVSWWLVLAVAALGTACSRGPAPPLSEDRFVAVMVELRRAARAPEGEAAFEPRRDEILREHGVSAAALQEYVTWARLNPQRLRDSFDRITTTLQEEQLE